MIEIEGTCLFWVQPHSAGLGFSRRAVEQGGVTVDGEKVVDIKQTFLAERFAGEGVVIKRGKKNFVRDNLFTDCNILS